MKKVTKDEFYKKMGPLDVKVSANWKASPDGHAQCKTTFKIKGKLVGLTIDQHHCGREQSTYYC